MTQDGVPGCDGAGSLDPTFGAAGVVEIFGLQFGQAVVAEGVVIDSSSRIVVAAGFIAGSRSCAVVRLLADGTPDTSFGANGVVRDSFDDHVCWYNDVALQLDGKIIAFGEIDGHTNPRGLIGRYLEDGARDPTFGEDGLLLFEPSPVTAGLAVAIDAEQRILVAGEVNSESFFTRRYLSNGTLDTSFGVEGIAEQAFAPLEYSVAYGVDVQGDGKVVVVGGVAPSPGMGAAGVVRYNTAGTRDASFGAMGEVADERAAGAGGIAFDSTGRAIVAGTSSQGGVLLRLMSDGTRDATFGDDGFVVDSAIPDLAYGDVATSGEYLIALGMAPEGFGSKIYLGRYLANGARDSAFGSNGFGQTLQTAGGLQRVGDVAIQANGHVVVVGGYGNLDSADIFVARYCQ